MSGYRVLTFFALHAGVHGRRMEVPASNATFDELEVENESGESVWVSPDQEFDSEEAVAEMDMQRATGQAEPVEENAERQVASTSTALTKGLGVDFCVRVSCLFQCDFNICANNSFLVLALQFFVRV
jgi:hypothetical protein